LIIESTSAPVMLIRMSPGNGDASGDRWRTRFG
jgi:hypothetical protein